MVTDGLLFPTVRGKENVNRGNVGILHYPQLKLCGQREAPIQRERWTSWYWQWPHGAVLCAALVHFPLQEMEHFQAFRKFWISFELWVIYSQVDFTIISFYTFKQGLILFGRCRRVYS